MKKKLLFFAAFLLLVWVFTPSAWASNFSAVAPSGQTLYYNLLNDYAEITYPRHYSDYSENYYYGYPKPSGALIIPSTVTYNGTTYPVIAIHDHAFYGCSDLTSVELPNTLMEIDEYAFYNCSSLNSINISNSVTSIGSYAFYNCSSLTSVEIPFSVTMIGDHAFSSCGGLTSIVVDSGNSQYDSRNNCNAIIQTSSNVLLFGCSTTTIPNTVVAIGPEAFRGCTSLLSLTLPDNVETVGFGAFADCINLTSANLGNVLTAVPSSMFSNCLRLMSIRIGDAVTSIGNYAFKKCGIIGELVIPQGIITIGIQAFSECYGINEITALGRVAPVLDDGVFEGVDSSIIINIPCNSTNIYAGRWQHFHNFNEVPFLFNAISENVSKGTVTVEEEPTCYNPYAIIRATPKSGYHFDHWSDGSTSNPYSYTATGSVTLIGYFASSTGIEETTGNEMEVSVSNGRIVVNGANGEKVIVSDMMGRVIASARVGESITVPAGGIYFVRIGNTTTKKVIVMR